LLNLYAFNHFFLCRTKNKLNTMKKKTGFYSEGEITQKVQAEHGTRNTEHRKQKAKSKKQKAGTGTGTGTGTEA